MITRLLYWIMFLCARYLFTYVVLISGDSNYISAIMMSKTEPKYDQTDSTFTCFVNDKIVSNGGIK